MKVRVRKWGNSLAIRVPKAVAEDVGLTEGTPVDVRATDGALVASPLASPTYSLADLLARITRANLHEEVDSGPPLGREAW